MHLTAEDVQQIVLACWIVGATSVATVCFAWTFSNGFGPALDHMGPQNLSFWFISIAALLFITSLSVGFGSCWLATWQLGEVVCGSSVYMQRVSETQEDRLMSSLFRLAVSFVFSVFWLFIWLLVMLRAAGGRYRRFVEHWFAQKRPTDGG